VLDHSKYITFFKISTLQVPTIKMFAKCLHIKKGSSAENAETLVCLAPPVRLELTTP
jgi:hypothetical protein